MTSDLVFQIPSGVVRRRAGSPLDAVLLALAVAGIVLSVSVPVLRALW
jgi:hypothetical protein